MSQVFKNGARTELDVGITTSTTQFTVIDGTIFPEASASVTGGAINQASDDWFKLVLQDDGGNFEIVYCYGHGYMTHTFTVLRGQEGTTARAFLEGTTVGLRLLSSDLDTIHSNLTLLDETKQDKSAPAAKADALTAARTITLSGAVQANATWDASGALELVTNNIDVSKANGGTLVVARGGTGTTTSTGSGSVVLNTSPALSGIPTAPTASAATNTTQLATTAFVKTATETRVAYSEKGAANGVATLDATGKVPSTQLPSYVDDVLEFVNLAAFPATGESGKIYVALYTNKTYRWSGSAYVYITSGAVDSVAGKTGVVTLVKADVGLANVDNTADSAKPVSTAQQAALDSKVDKVAGQRLLTNAEGTKLAGIAEQATKNAADSALRDRSSHTGTQPIATVAGLQPALDSKLPSSGGVLSGNLTVPSLNGGQLAGMRNKIINGKIDISQRGTSFAAIAAAAYSVDRFFRGGSPPSTAVMTWSQQADAPPNNEFQNSLRVTVTTADTSVTSSKQESITQIIEGYNSRDLIGNTFTLSFWVRSSKTGVHCISFSNVISDRSYVSEYTVNAANTWEFKTITVFGGLTTAGTWDWTNGTGVRVRFSLLSGAASRSTPGAWQTGNFTATANQVNCLDTVGNIFAITGVQLEVGEVATPFEHRPYGVELSLCQRYYFASFTTPGLMYLSTASYRYGVVYLPVTMRAAPTFSVYASAGSLLGSSASSNTLSTAYQGVGTNDGVSITFSNISAEL